MQYQMVSAMEKNFLIRKGIESRGRNQYNFKKGAKEDITGKLTFAQSPGADEGVNLIDNTQRETLGQWKQPLK